MKLADFAGKRVCFKDLMFPLLARMRGGLYYNTYIVPGCYRSDERCYKDLARLRGVEYLTWQDSTKVWKEREGLHPQMGTPHAKFTNYSFDLLEFMNLMMSLGDRVQQRKAAYFSQRIFTT
uniref:Uncharacterized protein n=1 Tax=Amphimedon queenslandica TaxID=400682 RepID=A0A1X7UND7_AMPQE